MITARRLLPAYQPSIITDILQVLQLATMPPQVMAIHRRTMGLLVSVERYLEHRLRHREVTQCSMHEGLIPMASSLLKVPCNIRAMKILMKTQEKEGHPHTSNAEITPVRCTTNLV